MSFNYKFFLLLLFLSISSWAMKEEKVLTKVIEYPEKSFKYMETNFMEFSDLESLEIEGNSLGPDDEEILLFANFPKLKSLKLISCNKINGSVLAKFKNLETLILYDCPLMDDSVIIYIKEIHALKNLELYNVLFSEKILNSLTSLESLKVLKISETYLSNDMINIFKNHFSDGFLFDINRKESDVNTYKKFYEEEFEEIINIPIEDEGFYDQEKTNRIDMGPFRNFEVNLESGKYLDFSNTNVTDQDLMRCSKSLPSVETIILRNCHDMKFLDISWIQSFPRLKVIDLEGCELSQEVINILLSLKDAGIIGEIKGVGSIFYDEELRWALELSMQEK